MDIQASALTKILANLFVFIALLSCLGVVLFDHITGRPIANYFLTILGSGVAYAISVVSNHQGATIGVAQEIESMNSSLPTTTPSTSRQVAPVIPPTKGV